MINKIQRIYKEGPLGDETSIYDVVFPDGMTVEEFIKTAVEENPDEWGEFKYGWQSPILAEYKHGEITYGEIYDRLKNRVINKATSNGGWTCMMYYLTI